MNDAASVSAADAVQARFQLPSALDVQPVGIETVELSQAVGRLIASTVTAPSDIPLVDQATVEGFAVRAADVATATETAPIRLRLADETGQPRGVSEQPIERRKACRILRGERMPRGADAVVPATDADLRGAGTLLVRRPVHAGQHMAFAGCELARGDVLVRRGRRIGAREIGLLAACGIERIEVYRRPTVAVVSFAAAGAPAPTDNLAPASLDPAGPMLAAAVSDGGGHPLALQMAATDAAGLGAALGDACDHSDLIVLSVGASRAAAERATDLLAMMAAVAVDLDRAVAPDGIACAATARGKSIVVLKGTPTETLVAFHVVVAPVLRRLAGLLPHQRPAVAATLATDVASEFGRTDYVMVGFDAGTARQIVARPVAPASGIVTGLVEADGYIAVAPPTDRLSAGQIVEVALFAPDVAPPDLIIAGSHCVGLEVLVELLGEQGIDARIRSIGSMAGLGAVRRGECDVAPIHILHPESGRYNEPFVDDAVVLVRGWRRRQGIVFRPGDTRFEGKSAIAAIDAVALDPAVLMVNRNAGAGTRFLIESLLKGRRPAGWANQPKSHNAVAAAVAQGRADWGMAIATVARAYGLGFLPCAEESFDFAIAKARLGRPAVEALRASLDSPELRCRLDALGLQRG